MNIYTVTLEDNEVLQNSLEICWQYTYPDLELAKSAVIADALHFRVTDGVARGASFEWRASEDIPAVVLEDRGRTWTIFKTTLVGKS